MKKLTALLLALIMCLGLLVSCDNEESSSSSSSSSSDNPNKDSVEIVGYYELDHFDFKSDAPNFAIYKTYDELSQAINIPLQDSIQSNFDDCYALLLHDIAMAFSYFSGWRCTNMTFGIDYDGGTEREPKVFLQIEVDLEEEGTDDVKILNHLIFIPKSEFEQKTDFSSYENKLQIIWVAIKK